MMKRIVFAWLGFFFMVCAAPGWAFDRVKEGERYRQWYAQFQKDIEALREHVPSGQPISNAEVERWCANSLVPGSRAIDNVRGWVSGGGGVSAAGGGIVIVGPTRIVISLLESSMPAGQGGWYPEKEGSPFPDKTLRVWYMHIPGTSILQTYFDEKSNFDPYRLPPDGVLERKAYPFLLFEDKGGRLRFGGVSQEWFGAVQYLHNIQFH